jgi:hypothetical protein
LAFSLGTTRVKAFEDLAPIEVADEMTLIEFELFKKIKEREFIGWNNIKDSKAARNIRQMIERSNKVRAIDRPITATAIQHSRASPLLDTHLQCRWARGLPLRSCHHERCSNVYHYSSAS